MLVPFPKILHLGHPGTEHIWESEVEITEKIDGSQLNFGVFDGQLHIMSKKTPIFPESPEPMFKEGVDFLLSIKDKLPEGWIFHSEYLRAKKHNTLTYDRVPMGHIMLFGLRNDKGEMLGRVWITEMAKKLGCSSIPMINIVDYWGNLTQEERLEKAKELIDRESRLGGSKMEGLVIKNYRKNMLFGNMVLPITCVKYVAEGFKEVNKENWAATNPNRGDMFAAAFRTEARWRKAVQALRDAGQLDGTPRDIGALVKHVHDDILEEDTELIKNKLFELFWKDIRRTSTVGFPEWYKDELAKGTFND